MRLSPRAKPVLVVSVLVGLVAWSSALMLVIDFGRMTTLW
jgi:hypothetical protein